MRHRAAWNRTECGKIVRSPFHGCASSMLQTAVDSCGKAARPQELRLTNKNRRGLSNGDNVMMTLRFDVFLSCV